jgi:hypothetical protein
VPRHFHRDSLRHAGAHEVPDRCGEDRGPADLDTGGLPADSLRCEIADRFGCVDETPGADHAAGRERPLAPSAPTPVSLSAEAGDDTDGAVELRAASLRVLAYDVESGREVVKSNCSTPPTAI